MTAAHSHIQQKSTQVTLTPPLPWAKGFYNAPPPGLTFLGKFPTSGKIKWKTALEMPGGSREEEYERAYIIRCYDDLNVYSFKNSLRFFPFEERWFLI